MTVLDTVNRVYREFKRYTGDGEPNEPSGAPLPVGDPQSGPHSPKKSELRAMFLEVLGAASDDADAAEAALAELERLYLGAKAEDPATDNEGGVLETGALYFNTTDSKFRVWTVGDVWQDQSTTLADGGVTEPKLAAGAVTEPKLAASLALTLPSVATDVAALKAINTARYVVAQIPQVGVFDWVSGDQTAATLRDTKVTTSVASSIGTIVGHTYAMGDAVLVTAAVNGLSVNTVYYVIVVDKDTFKLASSLANAKAGTNVAMSGTTNFTVQRLRDPLQAIYVIPTGVALSGSAGVWKRRYDGPVRASWFGVNSSSADIVDGMKAAFDFLPDGGTLDVRNLGDLVVNSLPVDPSIYWGQDGESAVDVGDPAAVGIRNRARLKILMHGTRLVPHATNANGYLLLFYKCYDCVIEGGEGVGNSTAFAGAGEACFVAFVRCVNCRGIGQKANQFYRNLFIYRCNSTSFEDCYSTNGGYFPFYASGLLDVPVAGVSPSIAAGAGANYLVRPSAQGGKYGNFYVDNCIIDQPDSRDCGRQGVFAAHFRNEIGFLKINGGRIYEGSNQNTGDQVDGVQIATASNFVISGIYPTNCSVIGMNIVGCTNAIRILGAVNITVANNIMQDYYRAGISMISRLIGADSYILKGVTVMGNAARRFNPSTSLGSITYNRASSINVEEYDSVTCTGTVIGNQGAVTNTITGAGLTAVSNPTIAS